MYKVLLVEPDSRSTEMLQVMLEWDQIGFELTVYSGNHTDAIALLDRNSYSLVLIGMNGAHKDALLLCEIIRKQSRLPIILIGGNNDFQLARKALFYQVNDYLPNPISAIELMASLDAVKCKLDCFNDKNKALTYFSQEVGSSSTNHIIEKVKEYVDVALNQNITLKHISTMLHFNCSYLGQKFKYHENKTFNEYLLQQRMEKAKMLLENTDMKVYEVANDVGYTEMDWFYKKFKAYTGVSANEYRKINGITA